MPAATLVQTVDAYNASAGNRPKLEGGPFVALGPVRAIFVHAEGGLAVYHQHRVLGADDQPIAGLYAAGSSGQGGLLPRGTAIISPGHSHPAGAPAAMQLWQGRLSEGRQLHVSVPRGSGCAVVVGDRGRGHQEDEVEKSDIGDRVLDTGRKKNDVVLANHVGSAVDVHQSFGIEHVVDLLLDLMAVFCHVGHRLAHRNPVVDVARAGRVRHEDVGGADGKLGLVTRVAVKQMQVKLGLPADSYPTIELFELLRPVSGCLTNADCSPR
jgi:hypothetical protein